MEKNLTEITNGNECICKPLKGNEFIKTGKFNPQKLIDEYFKNAFENNAAKSVITNKNE